MISFWLVAACLLLGALLFLLPPLLQRSAAALSTDARAANVTVYRKQLVELDDDPLDSGQRAVMRAEIERRALLEAGSAKAGAAIASEARREGAAAVAIAVLMPVAALALYFQLGKPALIVGAPPPDVQGQGQAAHALDNAQILAMVDRLARRLAANPADPDGWIMLARSYTVLGRHRDAASAYGRALEQRGDDAQVLADYADLLAMLQDRKLAGKPESMVMRALRIDPGNMKALALAGTAAYERRDYAGAADYWEQLLSRAPAGSDLERTARANVAEARALASGKPTKNGAAPGGAAAPLAAARATDAAQPGVGGVRGTVRVDERLRARMPADAVVFVVARAVNGPKMPLAILRMRLSDLPAAYVLDDEAAMSEQLRVSAFDALVVSARVSARGNAMPAPGDLQSRPQQTSNSARDVDLLIDQEVR